MFTKVLFYIVFIFSVAASALLCFLTWTTRLLPTWAVAVALVLLILVPVILLVLQKIGKHHRSRKKVRIVGIVLMCIGIIIEAFVAYYIYITNRTLDEVTEQKTQVTVIGAYVRNDDEAYDLQSALDGDYIFGILSNSDKESVDQVRNMVSEDYGAPMNIKEYASLLQISEAIREKDVDAILVNTAYLDIIEGLEGYETLPEELKCIYTSNIEVEITEHVFEVEDLPEEANTEELYVEPEELEYGDKGVFAVYISGIDTYGPVTTVSRSDVNIIAVVNMDTKNILLVSTPRDYYVPLPFAGGAMDKLTHAGVYGIEASMSTLGSYYGIGIDYYFRVNFTGFETIIDKLGGVDVDSAYSFSARGASFSKGINHLNGAQALIFARERYSFADGDRQRGKNQMAVIKGVIKGFASSTMLTNYASVMSELSGSFQTDMPKDVIGNVVQRTLSGDDWTVVSYSVNGGDGTDYCYALGNYAYVMRPYTSTVELARTLVSKVREGELITQEKIEQMEAGQ